MRARARTVSEMDSVSISVSRHSSQDSLGSESLYPPSTDSGSQSSLPTPSDVNMPRNIIPNPYLLDKDDLDVSYRLRLLVNNQYFLPPAHSKPLIPPAFVPQKEQSSSALRVLFRPTKDALSIRPRRKSESSRSLPPKFKPPPSSSVPRVAVLREQLPELSQALSSLPPSFPSAPSDYVEINPTDAVDLPPPSGLTVTHDVPTDLLVDNLVACDREEERWRRKLLSDAVGHSFTTTSPTSPASSLSYGSVRRRIPRSAPASPSIDSLDPQFKSILGRKISTPPLLSIPVPRPSFSRNRPSNFPHRTPLGPPPRAVINPLYSLSQTDLSNAAQSPYPSSGPTSSGGDSQHTTMPSTSTVGSNRPPMIPHCMTPPPPPDIDITHRPSIDTTTARTSSSTTSLYSQSSSRSHSELGEQDSAGRHSLALSALRDGYGNHGRSIASLVQDDNEILPPPCITATPTAISPAIPPRSPLRAIPTALPKTSNNHDDDDNRNVISPPPPRVSSSLGHRPHLQLAPAPVRKSSLAYPLLAGHLNQTTTMKGEGGEQVEEAEEEEEVEVERREGSGREEENVPGITIQPTTPLFNRSVHSLNSNNNNRSSPLPAAAADSTTNTPPPDSSFFDSLPASMTDFSDSSDDSDVDSDEEEELEPPPRITGHTGGSGIGGGIGGGGIGRWGNHSSPSIIHHPHHNTFHEEAYGGIVSGWNTSTTSFVSRTAGGVGSSIASAASSIKSTKSSRSIRSFFKRKSSKGNSKQQQEQMEPVGYVAESNARGASKYFKSAAAAAATGGGSSTHTFPSHGPRSAGAGGGASTLPYYYRPTDQVLSPYDVTRKSMSSSRASYSEDHSHHHNNNNGTAGAGASRKEFEGLLTRHLNQEKEEWGKIRERVQSYSKKTS